MRVRPFSRGLIEGEVDLVTGFEHQRFLSDFADANLGALQVAHDGDDRFFFCGDVSDSVDDCPMRLVVAMREVDACDVHPLTDHLPKVLLIAGSWTDGGDDLRSFAVDTIVRQSRSFLSGPRMK